MLIALDGELRLTTAFEAARRDNSRVHELEEFGPTLLGLHDKADTDTPTDTDGDADVVRLTWVFAELPL
jgi:hypothetical protein